MNEKLKIAGIDVSRGSVTVAILDTLPVTDMKRFAKTCKVRKFKSSEIDKLLALDFDAAILEPTGGHYSKLWAEKIKQTGREVRWVGHREVSGYRESWRLPDKTDKTDAVALACYGLERWHITGMFLDERHETAALLREKYLQLQFFNRAVTPLINRLRQQLQHECPELADRKTSRAWLGKEIGLWLAITGQASQKWQQEIEQSQGLGISPFSRAIAAQIVASDRELLRIESEIELILQDGSFVPYLEAMEPFHFGRRTSVALLGAIYPIEKFKEHHNPLGAFKLCCGMAQVWHESGDFKGWIPGGSVDVRRALWLWSYSIIPQVKGKNRGYVTSPELEALRDYYYNGSDQIIKQGKELLLKHFDSGKGSQRLMRTARRAITMLYRRIKALT